MKKTQTIGYVRVSSVDQSTDRQLDGVEIDRVFTDKVSGKDTNRPALQEMISFVRDGDTVLVHSIDRLARNLVDLRSIIEQLNAKHVAVSFIKENLTFTADTSNPMSTLMLNMMGAFAEFERSMIKERQKEGIAAAKVAGKHLGRKASLSGTDLASIRQRVAEGASKAALAVEFKVSRATIYNALQEG